MVYFRKAITTQILGGIMVFVLMFIGTESVVANEPPIPELLRVIISNGVTDANGRIDKFLKDNNLEILQCKVKDSESQSPCGSNSNPPFRDIRINPSLKAALTKTLRQSSLVADVQPVTETTDRLPGANDKQPEPIEPCAKISAPFFLLKSRDKTYFDGLGDFLKNTYQDKCGDCVQSKEVFPHSQKWAITYLNQKVLKKQDFVEKLELTFLWIEGDKRLGFATIVNGQYAPSQWKGKKEIPATEWKEMRCQHRKQLRTYAGKLRKKLKDYLLE